MKRFLRVLFDAGILALAAALAAVVLWPGVEAAGLAERVSAAMPDSGVKHPVTAVLMNFRGYDTLLEMLVLLLALIGVRSLGALPPIEMPESASPVLAELLRFLTPLLLLVAVYLLWRGSSGPGGAFQAGAVLGAAGVLWLLAERPGGRVPQRLPLRPLLALGVAAFAGAGITFAFTEGALLAYPVASAYSIIFAIEALATLSIATTLVVLFIGAPVDER
jgi:multisubunit Na+/H+ antiporter MnhB subunit